MFGTLLLAVSLHLALNYLEVTLDKASSHAIEIDIVEKADFTHQLMRPVGNQLLSNEKITLKFDLRSL